LVQHQVFAFDGDNLYRVHSDTRETEYMGSGWSGTEAATVHSGNLFAVQGGHLWRCNLTTGVCVDIGANWSGTSFLTNDGTSVYGIQGNALWKVNTNGGWSQLGIGEWGGSTEMGFSSTIDALFIVHGGTLWQVHKSNGTWIDKGSVGVNPLVMPHHSFSGGCGSCIIGIESFGSVITFDLLQPGLVGNQTNYIWSGSTDISYTRFTPSGTTVPLDNVFILKNGQVHHYQKSVPMTSGTYAYQGAVPGLTNTYKIASTQGL
jgi:hypothetical protein